MQPFANSYWTPDYISGLRNLQSYTYVSLNQLHDFRKLIFNYLKYFHSNSEYLNKTSNELASTESFSGKIGEIPKYYSCIEMFRNEMLGESTTLLQLASSIDKFVLDDLTNYLKHHESSIKKEFSRLEELYEEYLTLSQKMEKSKSKYFDELRLREVSQPQVNEQERPQDGDDYDYSDDESYFEEDSQNSIRRQIDADLKFPLHVGTVIFETIEEFQVILAQIIAETPTVKRKIPIPGYKNDLFASESLCEALNDLRIKGLKPTRSNFEKFGQSLVTLKLLNPTNIFQKRFKSEGVWFEWSDLAIHVSQFHEESTPSTPVKQLTPSNRKVSSPSSRFMSDMAETTTRFNSMFNNVKSSIMKKNHEEIVSDIIDQYNEQNLELQESAYLLQKGFSDLVQYLEKFETTKVQIIYSSSAKLSQIIQKFHLQQFNQIQACGKGIAELNKQQNYEHDLSLHLDKSSTGVLFSLTTEAAFSPQSLKYQFDLFEDISAQLSMGQVTGDCPASIFSTPFMVHRLREVIESHKDDDLKSIWLQSLDMQSAWKIKQDITHVISQCSLPTDKTGKEQKVHIINDVLKYFEEKKAGDAIIFFKSWLLELKDSVIPFTAFDSVINLYDGEHTDTSLVKVLSSLPRCNLACLLSITEHLSKIFELDVFENYGTSDKLSEKPSKDASELQLASKNLNNMDAIGSIPFVHLIMRPSSVKYKTGFKPPLDQYIQFLGELLKVETRAALFEKLIEHETKYKQKKESELKAGLQIKKVPLIEVPTSRHENEPSDKSDEGSVTPTKQKHFAAKDLKAPNPINADAFTLRPFKTKTTPLPSPRNSPKHGLRENGDENRSRSSSVLGATIDVQFN
ncbi:hypothetical protein CORT_0F03070 [Candida orthopsilosis Co 90-125]|uniref:Rho-GAP domain-containing protein n=1 Tax=Candida orthopsilosis (strain 90-125) TaxID=1136231 RepID=H8X8Q6_CANO9|nr:hypothetical protein CORT_0F03070 [Candida orthopsilosis Co 90-125]CCG24531.1 hypothetical protein CORT_0F03070 [Candida orthopsilosis Co 90-125]